MSVTSGFYNSLNGDRRYNAEQMSALFDTIINDGVFANVGTAFAVTAAGKMKVNIGIGRAWFNSTWLYNDAVASLTVNTSEVLLDRYDAVVLEINHTESVRAGDIKMVKGTPSSEPQFPTMTNETEVHQYPLAYIYVKAGVTEITQADITNKVGTSDCPFITGILQVQNIDNIVAQWMSEWDQLVDTKESEFDDWFARIKSILDDDIATQLINRLVKLEDGTTPAGDANLLNGLTVVEVGQSGARNLIPYPYTETTLTRNGVTFTDNRDGTISFNGTATGSTYFYLNTKAKTIFLPKGTYTLSGATEDSTLNTYGLRVHDYDKNLIVSTTGKSVTFTLDDDEDVYVVISVSSDITADNVTFKPMLELGPVAHEYVPYLWGGAEYAANAGKLEGQSLNNIKDWTGTQYVPLAGDKTMTGPLKFGNGYSKLNGSAVYTELASFNDPSTIVNARYLILRNSAYSSGALANCLQLHDVVDNKKTIYDVIHTGNMSLINGGNAKTWDGWTIFTSRSAINSSFTDSTTIQEIAKAMPEKSKLYCSVWSGSTSVYPQANGFFSIEKIEQFGYISLSFIGMTTHKEWHGIAQVQTSGAVHWSGWILSSDGGNADKIDGYHAYALLKATGENPSDFTISQMARVLTNNDKFPAAYGMYVAFSCASSANVGKYILHLYHVNGKLYHQRTADGGIITKAGWKMLLDAGNSAPVAISASAPSSGLWVVP